MDDMDWRDLWFALKAHAMAFALGAGVVTTLDALYRVLMGK